MASNTFVLVTDTPSVKQFVFGTDRLAEIRGASALLDRLNRGETETLLQKELTSSTGARVEVLYANGGSGQFIVRECTENGVRQAAVKLVRCRSVHQR